MTWEEKEAIIAEIRNLAKFNPTLCPLDVFEKAIKGIELLYEQEKQNESN